MKDIDIQPLAETDLEKAWCDTFERWGVAQADAYVDLLYDRMRLLFEQPYLGRVCDELRRGYRRILTGSHIVFYRVDGETIVIVRVLHEKMDFDAHL